MADNDHSLLLLDILDTQPPCRVGKGAPFWRVKWEKVLWAFLTFKAHNIEHFVWGTKNHIVNKQLQLTNDSLYHVGLLYR